jgi:hypothetical protein
MIFKYLFGARSLYYVMKKETGGRRIMHLLRKPIYWRYVRGGVWKLAAFAA